MTQEKSEPVQLQIQLDDDTAQGMYINLTLVNHTDTEFTVDHLYVQPHQPQAKVRSRVILSAKHAKKFMFALQENIRRFESRFGNIDLESQATVSIPVVPQQGKAN